MEVQEDTIFVSNMGTEVTEELLIQHFGSIGVIKVSVLFICVFVCAHRFFFFGCCCCFVVKLLPLIVQRREYIVMVTLLYL